MKLLAVILIFWVIYNLMGYLSESKKNESVIPTFQDILVAHSTLGDLLHNHFNGNTPPPDSMKTANKLGIIAAPQPIKK